MKERRGIMSKVRKAGKILSILLIFMMTIFVNNENIFAAEVSTFEQLKSEIKSGTEDITIKGTIQVTETLIVMSSVPLLISDFYFWTVEIWN